METAECCTDKVDSLSNVELPVVPAKFRDPEDPEYVPTLALTAIIFTQ
jgi:hypothetical protein